MGRLVLVRHAAPTIDPQTPSADWALSEDGEQAAGALAGALASFAPAILVSGEEPKMIGTARTIGGRLGLVNRALPGLCEHARRSTPHGDRDAFEAAIADLFNRPDEIVYGDESANQTYDRVAAAIDEALDSAGDSPVIAVTGGTAISLIMARRLGIDAFLFWKALRLPQAFIVDTAPWRLEATMG